MPPLTDAMSLVDGEQIDPAPGQCAEEGLRPESLRGAEDDADISADPTRV